MEARDFLVPGPFGSKNPYVESADRVLRKNMSEQISTLESVNQSLMRENEDLRKLVLLLITNAGGSITIMPSVIESADLHNVTMRATHDSRDGTINFKLV